MASISDSLRVASLNLHGLKNSWHYLQQLLDGHDLLFVQEHWLHTCELDYLQKLHNDFIVYGKSAMDEKDQLGLTKGRPFGGIAVFIRKSISNFVSVVGFDDDSRIICVWLVCHDLDLLMFGSYFPCYDSSAKYIDTILKLLGYIESVVDMYAGCKVDLNFECSAAYYGFRIFDDFAVNVGLVSCDVMVPAGSYSCFP